MRLQSVGGEQRGFTLAELLVTVAVLGLLLAGTVGLLGSGMRAYAFGSARVTLQQEARVALERMAREIRGAGYDPREAGLAAVVVAEPTRIAFQRDLNGNGVIDPTRERVTYLVRTDGILRRDAGAGAQPVIGHVRRLALSYRDRAGAPTSDAARVALVRIELDVGTAGVRVHMATEAALRAPAAP